MSDLIRRKDLCDYISAAYYDDRFNDPVVLLDEFFERAKHFSAVDAVEVVRCKDCRFSKPADNNDYIVCEIMECYCGLMKDDFCVCGKRREENAVD